MSTLWLIRHGQSVGNIGVITDDYVTMELTAFGRRQAEIVASACPEPDRIIVSGYARAQQTLSPTKGRFPSVPIKIMPVHEFTYLAGLVTTNLFHESRQSQIESYWSRMDPESCAGQGAESFAAFTGRVRDFLQAAARWHGLSLVFTHANFIRAAILQCLMPDTGKSMELFGNLRRNLDIPNGAIIRMHHFESRWWTSNIDASHLKDGI